jgi:hypothetical protein
LSLFFECKHILQVTVTFIGILFSSLFDIS